MNKFLKRTLFFSIFIIVCVTGILAFLYFFTSVFQGEDIATLNEHLEQADDYIAAAYLHEAGNILEKAFDSAHTPYSCLRVLKRFFMLASISRNYKQLKDYAFKAYEQFPGSEEILSVTLYACLRDGDLGKAANLKYNFRSQTITALLAEDILRRNKSLTANQKEQYEGFLNFIELESSEDPLVFQRVGRDYNEPRIIADAISLFMGQGEIEQAYNLCEELGEYDTYNELIGMVAYDYEKNNIAEDHLEILSYQNPERIDIMIILGDIYLLEDEYGKAERYYKKALESNPELSAIPYINLAWIQQKQAHWEYALYLLQEARKYFPENRDVNIELAKLHYRKGRQTEAKEVLQAYLESNRDDFTAELLNTRISWDELSLQQCRAELRELFNKSPADNDLCQVLVWYLLSLGDIKTALEVLQQYGLATEESKNAWFYHALGVIQALESDFPKAREYLEQSIMLTENWEVYYNYAYILFKMGEWVQAKEECGTALNGLQNADLYQEMEDVYHSKIRTLLGEIHLEQGNWESAERELQYAVDLNPQNIKAWSALKKLADLTKK